jgi:hypothetical protein
MTRMTYSPRATRYCKTCGACPREWHECEEPYCEIETQEEADARGDDYDDMSGSGHPEYDPR